MLGYAGYYVCRSNLSVALPLLVDELATSGLSRDAARVRLGGMMSLGVLAYAIGKFAAGAVADLAGGRRAFLGGMVGAVLCTLAFAVVSAPPLFTLAWIANRGVQSFGWPGLVRIASRWTDPARYGAVMGVVSLSYLFGDAAARAGLGGLLALGLGWRALFATAAAALALIALPCAWLLRESPRERGLPEPVPSATTLYRDAEPAAGVRALLAPLLASPTFWLVCLLSLGLTLLRETFNSWTPLWLVDAIGMERASAAAASAAFPFAGGIAVVAAGFARDRLGRAGRAWILLLGLVASSAGLFVLSRSDPPQAVAVAALATLGVTILAPYSYLAGAVSLDLGGARGSATACGIIDGIGYLGGVLAGDTMARLQVGFGWSGALTVLAGVAAASSVVAAAFLAAERRA